MIAAVVDASIALAWCLPDEQDAFADDVLDHLRDGEMVVPSLWAIEVGNSVLNAERRGRLSVDAIASIVDALQSLRVRTVEYSLARSTTLVLPLARRYGLSVYDATYLDAAGREGLPLATLDKRLRAAAKKAGIEVFER